MVRKQTSTFNMQLLQSVMSNIVRITKKGRPWKAAVCKIFELDVMKETLSCDHVWSCVIYNDLHLDFASESNALDLKWFEWPFPMNSSNFQPYLERWHWWVAGHARFRNRTGRLICAVFLGCLNDISWWFQLKSRLARNCARSNQYQKNHPGWSKPLAVLAWRKSRSW